MKLAPKNWREFQHYSNRCPPWIRLQRKLLDDKDFHRLPVASRALAPMLWLLASESVNGVFDGSVDEIAFRLRASEKDIEPALKPLIEKGFFLVVEAAEQDASTALADGEQVAPESCSEAEALQRQMQSASAPSVPGVSDELLRDYLEVRKAKRAGKLTATAVKGLQREAEKAGVSLSQAVEACCEFGWQGFRADWYADRVKASPQKPDYLKGAINI